MWKLLLKLVAQLGGIELTTTPNTKYAYIEDDVEGRVLVDKKTAEIIVALQDENKRLSDELELQRRLNR